MSCPVSYLKFQYMETSLRISSDIIADPSLGNANLVFNLCLCVCAVTQLNELFYGDRNSFFTKLEQ